MRKIRFNRCIQLSESLSRVLNVLVCLRAHVLGKLACFRAWPTHALCMLVMPKYFSSYVLACLVCLFVLFALHFKN